MGITLAGVQLTPQSFYEHRLSLLLWGSFGVGKTVYACSAPGNKLLINFDPKGPASLGNRDDVFVLDWSGNLKKLFDELLSPDPMGLNKFLSSSDGANISSIIVDSLTPFMDAALERGLQRTLNYKGASMDIPVQASWMPRKINMIRLVSAVTGAASVHQKHVVLTAHEAYNEETNIFTPAIGGGAGQGTGLRVSEVWRLKRSGKKRIIVVSGDPSTSGTKTRMFKEDVTSFECSYVQDDPSNRGSLAELFELWQRNKFHKLSFNELRDGTREGSNQQSRKE